ncbi:Exosome complex component RRP41 [Gurleya vavrai]
MEVLSKEGFRIDGRKPENIRRITINHQTHNNTPHLSYSQGITHLNLSLSNIKRQSTKLRVKINFSLSSLKENIKMDHKAFELENILINTFEDIIIEKQVFICIEVVQDDGSLISSMINAISLFLCLCAIPIYNLVVSVQISKIREGMLCDTTFFEEGRDGLILGYIHNNKNIAYLQVFGKLKPTSIQNLVEKAKLKCDELFLIFRDYLKSKENDLKNS